MNNCPYNNIKYLSKLVQNGRDIYPGANYVLKSYLKDDKKSIQKIDLKYIKFFKDNNNMLFVK